MRAGYSKRNACKIGPELLGKTRIAERIAELVAPVQAELREKLKVTREQMARELLPLCMSNMANYATWGTKGVEFKSSESLTPEQTAAVQRLRQTVTKDGGTIIVELYDKAAAIEKLARLLGLNKEQPTGVPDNAEEAVSAARKALMRLPVDELRAIVEAEHDDTDNQN
jgi:phage terminase small subunit